MVLDSVPECVAAPLSPAPSVMLGVSQFYLSLRLGDLPESGKDAADEEQA